MVGSNECDCDHLCAGRPGCIAIWVDDKGECWLVCPGRGVAPESPQGKIVKRPLDTKINLSVKEATLASIASFIAARCEGELLIPASRLDEAITLTAKNLTLRAAAAKLGLVVR
jgi:hypothetical protein